jgi:hypothetical protein
MDDWDTWTPVQRINKVSFHSWDADKSIIDDISVMGDDGTAPPLSIESVDPPVAYILTKTVTLTATPAGGSGTYTQVQFDIGNNGSYEYTDPSAPFQYVWDTAATQSGKGTVDVKMTVTDSTLATGSTVFTFKVDNRNGGRIEKMTNAGFENWQTGNPNLPEDWSEWQPNGNASYGPDADVPTGGGSFSLQVTFTAFDTANRFTLIWKGYQNDTPADEDHQVCYWGKGLTGGLRYWTSTDGATWTDSGFVAANVGSADWKYDIGEPQATLGAANEWQTISTANTEFTGKFDNISWMTSPGVTPPPPPTPTPTPVAVTSEWGLYE